MKLCKNCHHVMDRVCEKFGHKLKKRQHACAFFVDDDSGKYVSVVNGGKAVVTHNPEGLFAFGPMEPEEAITWAIDFNGRIV